MGRFDCDLHGVTGMIFTCAHIRQNLGDREKTEKIIKDLFPDDYDTEEKFKWHKKLFYCARCAVENNFPSENSELPQDDFGTMYDKDFAPACYDCFKELDF